MSATANRQGAPFHPSTTTAGTPGSTDEVRTFVKSTDGTTFYARPCIVTNTSASDTLYVLVNEEDATATTFLVALAPLQALDVSIGGRLNVRFVSLFYATAAYSAAEVRGWYP